MEDYASNSHKSKAELASQPPKKIEKVTHGKVKVKKRGEMSKLKDVFIAEDTSSIKSYVLMDVLVPAIKKAVRDIVTDGIEMLLYGSTGHGRKSTSASYVSYDRFSRDDRRYESSVRPVAGYSYNNIVLESRGEAEEVLARMDELMAEYGLVTVADLYDLVGVTGQYTDNKYGWMNIRSAEIVRVRDGYVIKLPKAQPIN